MGNFRGNTYSKKHAWLDVNSKQFWEFSWDEMAAHDLPAMLDYVFKTTGKTVRSLFTSKSFYSGQERIAYMGHSMGTMTAFALFSMNQTIASKVKA